MTIIKNRGVFPRPLPVLETGTLSKLNLFSSVSIVGVAEHFRNRDRIFQGPSEPPDELPATSPEH